MMVKRIALVKHQHRYQHPPQRPFQQQQQQQLLSELWSLTLTTDYTHRLCHDALLDESSYDASCAFLWERSGKEAVLRAQDQDQSNPVLGDADWADFRDAFSSAFSDEARTAMEVMQEGPEARCSFHLGMLQLWRQMLEIEVEWTENRPDCEEQPRTQLPCVVNSRGDHTEQQQQQHHLCDTGSCQRQRRRHLTLLLRMGQQLYASLRTGAHC